jgi:hypothetical protein
MIIDHPTNNMIVAQNAPWFSYVQHGRDAIVCCNSLSSSSRVILRRNCHILSNSTQLSSSFNASKTRLENNLRRVFKGIVNTHAGLRGNGLEYLNSRSRIARSMKVVVAVRKFPKRNSHKQRENDYSRRPNSNEIDKERGDERPDTSEDEQLRCVAHRNSTGCRPLLRLRGDYSAHDTRSMHASTRSRIQLSDIDWRSNGNVPTINQLRRETRVSDLGARLETKELAAESLIYRYVLILRSDLNSSRQPRSPSCVLLNTLN